MHHWLRGMDAPVVTRQMFLIPMRLHHALAELSVHKSDKTQQHLNRPSVRGGPRKQQGQWLFKRQC